MLKFQKFIEYGGKIMEDTKGVLSELARNLDGKIEEVGILPDESGYAVMTLPLPEDHWLTKDPETFNVPPMPSRMGKGSIMREAFEKALWAAGKYAVRCATDNGKEDDFDPDALIQNLVVGMLGYHTKDGLSEDDWANPKEDTVSLLVVEDEVEGEENDQV
jgi:hypothetical protein